MADRPLLMRASAAWPDNTVHGIVEAVPTPRVHTNLPTARLIQIPVAGMFMFSPLFILLFRGVWMS